MLTKVSSKQELFGSMARRVRLSLHMTQRELAEIAGVSKEAVYLFEHNLPVYLDARRKILKQLWAIQAGSNLN
jgi:transcriptional regulator with XRE-family HTH domain